MELMKKDAQEIETAAYTFQVVMLVQVIADSENLAKEKLDRDGGYVTKREVELRDSYVLYNGEKE